MKVKHIIIAVHRQFRRETVIEQDQSADKDHVDNVRGKTHGFDLVGQKAAEGKEIGEGQIAQRIDEKEGEDLGRRQKGPMVAPLPHKHAGNQDKRHC